MIDDFRGEYRWLSNFHVCDIMYEGILYPSTEHAYQAAKTLDPKLRELMSVQPSPKYAKRLGRLIPIREDWERVKIKVMEEVTRLKYLHEDLQEKLMATDPHELIEGNTWGDVFWGVCNGKGRNELGKVLMREREYLRVVHIMGID